MNKGIERFIYKFIHSQQENLAIHGEDERALLSINHNRSRLLSRGSRRLIGSVVLVSAVFIFIIAQNAFSAAAVSPQSITAAQDTDLGTTLIKETLSVPDAAIIPKENIAPKEKSGPDLFIDNLVLNPGFEDGVDGGGIPLYWESHWNPPVGYKKLDDTEKHAGKYSWKFVKTSKEGWQGAYSDYIPIKQGQYYQLSAWVKSSAGGEKETVALGWEEFDKDKLPCVPWAVEYFVAYDQPMPSTWIKLQGVYRAKYPNAEYVRLRVFGPDIGTVWWDDFVLQEFKEDLEPFGYAPDPDARSIDFGAPDEERDGVRFNQEAVTEKKSEGDITYRQLKPKAQLTLEFPAFNVDENGLPLSPMLLEAAFQDTVSDQPKREADGKIARHRVFVRSKITDKRDWQVDYLGGAEDNKWKYTQYAFVKTGFQLLKAIDGKFTIKVIMPDLVPEDGNLYLPLDYVSLRKISPEEERMFVLKQRDKNNFYYLDLPADGLVKPSDPQLVLFARDPMHPLYKHTKPQAEEINKALVAFSAKAEKEPVSFGLYSKDGINNLTCEVSDLAYQATAFVRSGKKIPKENIKISRVVYDEKRLGTYGVSKAGKGYSLIPDRLEDFSTLSVAPDTSERIWLSIEVPEGITDGLYIGNVLIKRSGVLLKSLPIQLTVLPIKLEPAEHLNTVTHDPWVTYPEKNPVCNIDEIFAFYKDLGVNDLFLSTFWGDVQMVLNGKIIVDFNIEQFEAKLDRVIQEGLVDKKMIIHIWNWFTWVDVYSHIHGSYKEDDIDFYSKLSHPEFVDAVGLLVRKLITACNERGISPIFFVIDEPWGGTTLRIIADRLLTYVKDNGGETVVTYAEPCEEPLKIKPEQYKLPDAMNQTLPPLTDKTDYKVWWDMHQGLGYAKGYKHYGYYTTDTSYLRNPIYNRFLHGWLAARTNSEAVFAYANADYILDPNEDFDGAPEFVAPFTYPDFIFAYPHWSGKLIPTLAAVGIQEGIKDAKYIATLKRLLREKSQLLIAKEAEKYLEAISLRINPDYWVSYPVQSDPYGYANKIVKDLSAGNAGDYAIFTTIRKKVADYIVKLQQNYSADWLKADVNLDGKVNNFDIDPFIGVLTKVLAGKGGELDPRTLWAADCNDDTKVNMFDIEPFIKTLRKAGVPEKVLTELKQMQAS